MGLVKKSKKDILQENDVAASNRTSLTTTDKVGKRKRRIKKKTVKRIVKLGIFLAILGIAVIILKKKVAETMEVEEVITTAFAEIRDVETVLTSSGTIQPLAEYDIATLVKGEIIAADFEVGDTVEEGSVLYQLTTDEVETEIETAKTTLERAQASYEKAVASKEKMETKYEETIEKYNKALDDYEEVLADYNEAVDDYNEATAEYDDLNLTAEYGGTISAVYVNVGDTVSAGGKLADVYDDSTMILTVPFNADSVDSSLIGEKAEVEVTGTFETITGKVTGVEDKTTVLSGNQIVKMVTIRVDNPGGISVSRTATATIGDVYSNSEGSFSFGLEETLTASKAGEISYLSISSGDKVREGDSIAIIDSDSVESQLESYQKVVDSAANSLENAQSSVDNAYSSISDAKDSVESAQDSIDDCQDAIEDAESALEEQTDALEDCYITAPVTGQVITKNMLVGDVIGTSNFSNTLAVLYDLSAVTFEMYVDELDIGSVVVGQEVNVTADALENVEITGYVTNVSLVSTTSGGVTQYPITVRIDEVGDLLPGMNVTGEIIIEGVKDVITVPTDALQRGNYVYVKDETVTEEDGDVPAGFRAVEVEIGLSDGDYIQIISGIEEGEEVFTARTTTSTDSSLFGLEGLTGTDGQGSGGMPSESGGFGDPSGSSSGSSSGGGMPSGGGPGGGR